MVLIRASHNGQAAHLRVKLTGNSRASYIDIPMRDRPALQFIKFLVRRLYLSELQLSRWFRKRQGQSVYLLKGSCNGCGRCCDEPSIQVGKLIWYMPLFRFFFLFWQSYGNGFDLLRKERETKTFIFTCRHFDTATRTCDSYYSRPGICMDYPKILLDQPWPQLFDECGYRAVSLKAQSMSHALDQTKLSEAEKEALKKKLFLK